MSIREHFLHVAVAKLVFLHEQHGIVFLSEPLTLAVAASYGLTPLLLYSVTEPVSKVDWLQFSTITEPLPLKTVLASAWRDCPQLGGLPDTVQVGAKLAESCERLDEQLAAWGVKLAVAQPAGQRFGAALRRAQQSAGSIHIYAWWGNQDVVKSVTEFNGAAARGTDFMFHLREKIAPPIGRPGPELPPAAVVDWRPGQWLASWQGAVPPAEPLEYWRDHNGAMFLSPVRQSADPAASAEADECWKHTCDTIDLIKVLLAVWPNTPAAVAAAAGTTLRELQWFTSGRGDLAREVFWRLTWLLAMRRENDGYYEVGPCMILVDKLKPAIKGYHRLSSGCLEYSAELVPSTGTPDPSWRYVIVFPDGAEPSVMMVPRGSEAARGLTAENFYDFAGLRSVSQRLYNDLISSCGLACDSPEDNARAVRGFTDRNYAELMSLRP